VGDGESKFSSVVIDRALCIVCANAAPPRIETIGGGRTSFFVPDLDLILLGVRASGGEGVAIWVYRALP